MYKRYAPWLHRIIAPLVLALGAPVILAQAPPTPSPAPAPATTPAPAPAAEAAAPGAAPVAPVMDEASSYSIGLVLGTQLRSGGFDETRLLGALLTGCR